MSGSHNSRAKGTGRSSTSTSQPGCCAAMTNRSRMRATSDGIEAGADAELIAGPDLAILGRGLRQFDGTLVVGPVESREHQRERERDVGGAVQRRPQIGVERREFFRRRLLGELDVRPEPLLRLVVREGHGALGGGGRLGRCRSCAAAAVDPAMRARAVGVAGRDPRVAMVASRRVPGARHPCGRSPAGAARGAGAGDRHGTRRVRQALDAEVARLRSALVAGAAEAGTREFASALLVERLDAHAGSDARCVAPPRHQRHRGRRSTPTSDGRRSRATRSTAMQRVGAGYSNLEFDLEDGPARLEACPPRRRAARGDRRGRGVATNNTAAGLTLALAAIASGREVIISRGELVEIGGGFRVPEILRGSGAQLREVGTTNRTRVADYAAAISDRTAAILRVHPSNFRMDGFTERPALADLAALAHAIRCPTHRGPGIGMARARSLRRRRLPAGGTRDAGARAGGARQRARWRRPRRIQWRQAARRTAGRPARRTRRPRRHASGSIRSCAPCASTR